MFVLPFGQYAICTACLLPTRDEPRLVVETRANPTMCRNTIVPPLGDEEGDMAGGRDLTYDRLAYGVRHSSGHPKLQTTT